MNLPPLPKPSRIDSHGYKTVAGYTEAQMLALQQETVEACANVCEQHQYEWTYGSTYADGIRNLLK